jgi:hypothetical protein
MNVSNRHPAVWEDSKMKTLWRPHSGGAFRVSKSRGYVSNRALQSNELLKSHLLLTFRQKRHSECATLKF